MNKLLSATGMAVTAYVICATALIGWQWGRMDPTVMFGGDEWEYQSIAVNYALGGHVMTSGMLYNLSNYSFNFKDSPQFDVTHEDFMNPRFNHYREPVYPMLMGGFYRLFGTDPVYFKRFQLILLWFTGLLTVIFGMTLFNGIGAVAGTLAGIAFLIIYGFMGDQIMTEVVVTFIAAVYCVFLLRSFKAESVTHWVMLGLFGGLMTLTKGVLLPLYTGSMLVLLYFHWQRLRRVAATVLITVAVVGPYSEYSRSMTSYRVLVTSQGADVLLSGNNEHCLDGAWHPEWTREQESYYQRSDCTDPHCVLLFYAEHPELFVPIMSAKLKEGILARPSYRLAVSIGWIYVLSTLLGVWWLLGLSVLPFVMVVLYARYTGHYFTDYLSPVAVCVFMMGILPFIWLMRSHLYGPRMWFCALLIVVPVVINLMFYGLLRFVMPFDWAVMTFVLYLTLGALWALIRAAVNQRTEQT